jgi:CDP-paratose 2-epimerase
MSIAIVTGATGLVGSEAVRRFHSEGLDVIGIDNDMRRTFFANIASADSIRSNLEASLPRYHHVVHDIRDEAAVDALFAKHGKSISVIIHAAAQPSHDWAADNPLTDFSVNALGTLVLLEAARNHCPDAVFIHCSTNKVYGAQPNALPFVEHETRWEPEAIHPFFAHGVTEAMSIDRTMHSLFGVSKTAADLMVQEYGLYHGMRTVAFRCGCITGGGHRGAPQHGFLSYLAECAAKGKTYQIIGYKGKQVRDNIHASDLVSAFAEVLRNPRSGAVYNIGGGRERSCSVIEAAELFQSAFSRTLPTQRVETPRLGDHIWWITDTALFRSHYPDWTQRFTLQDIVDELTAAHRVSSST